MDSALIEKLDADRYKYSLRQTVGLGIIWTVLISYMMVEHRELSELWYAILCLTGISGMVLLLPAWFRLTKVKNRILGDKELDEALNNEMHKAYENKAVRVGYGLVMGLVLPLSLLMSFDVISGTEFAFIILFVGGMGERITYLVLNK